MSARYNRRRPSRGAEINMAPLIDMVFILLIFFLVTTSFVRESGVDVDRPEAETATRQDEASLLVGVTRDGLLYIEGRPVDIRLLRSRVEQFLAETPDGSTVVVADKECRTGIVIKVVDECRLGGANRISIAAGKIER